MPPKKVTTRKTSKKSKANVKKTVVEKITPVKRTVIANLPFSNDNKNLDLLKYLMHFGKEFGYINSRNSKIIHTVIKSKKGNKFTIEFTIDALDGGQEYINKIKNSDLIQEFNQIKRRLKSAFKEKDNFDVLSELKFIK